MLALLVAWEIALTQFNCCRVMVPVNHRRRNSVDSQGEEWQIDVEILGESSIEAVLQQLAQVADTRR